MVRQTKQYMGWVIWGIAAAFVLFQFLLQASTSVMIPCLIKAFNINTEQVGFLSANFFYTYILLQIPSGLLVDKIGAKKLLLGGLLLCIIAAVIFGLSNNLPTAEFSRLLMGLAAAPSVVCAMYLASQWLPCEKFALAAGLTEMLGMLGGAIGEAFLAHCIDFVGWRETMFICASVGFILLLLTLLFIQDRPKNSVQTTGKNSRNIKQDLIELARDPQIWLIGLFAGLIFAIIQAFSSLWAVPFLMQTYPINLDVAAAASAMMFLGTALFAPILGIISNAIGKRKPLMYIGAFISLLCISIIIYFPPVKLAWMFVILFMLGASCSSYVIPFAIAREITRPSVRATALGFINMMTIIIGAPLLQPLIGYMLDSKTQYLYFNHYQIAFISLPLVLALGVIITFFIKETGCVCIYE